MKKTVLMLALTSAFAAGAHAQTNVTIYGIADAAVEWGKFNRGVNLTRLQSGDIQASRLGFRGTEDLGGGMKANFGMELGYGMDTGAGAVNGVLWNRGSSVGLEGGWGRVDLGKQYAPMFWTALGSEASTYEFANPSVMLNTEHTSVTGRSGIGGFYDNVLRFRTPVFGGVSSEISYSTGNERTGAQENDGVNMGFNLHYANGPLWTGYAFNRYTDRAATATRDTHQKTHLLGAKYNFGSYVVGGNIMRTTDMVAGANTGDAKAWQLTTKVKVATGDVNLGVGQLRQDNNRKATAMHVGYVHFLSKTTQLYGYLSHVSNNANGNSGLANMNSTYKLVDAGFNPTGVAVGLRKSF